MHCLNVATFSLAVAGLLAACTTMSGHRLPKTPSAAPIDGPAVEPRTYYVDPQVQQGSCTTYSTSRRTCNAGEELAFNDLESANTMAQAGDIIVLRGGLYSTSIKPAASGTAASPIVYRNQMGEVAVITVADNPAIQLIGVQHVLVSGLVVRDSLGWGRIEDAHYNVISDNRFIEALARGTTGGLKFVRSHYNLIERNSFFRANDSIVLQESDHNRIALNHLEFARHSLISIRCSNFNVVRSNYLHNERQKASEIYDCEGTSDAPIRFDATKRNLFEGNNFSHVAGSSRPDQYNGIQYSQQLGIVRNNLFSDNRGGAIHFAIYEQEALYNYGNRIFGNRFVANHCLAVSGGKGIALRAEDNRVFGNLLAGNTDCHGGVANKPNGSVFTSYKNLESASATGELPVIWHARTRSAGFGRLVDADDVLPFFDGFGNPGEIGDELAFENSAHTVRLQQIDYAAGTLVLDRALTWSADEGIRIVAGSLPDPQKALPVADVRQ